MKTRVSTSVLFVLVLVSVLCLGGCNRGLSSRRIMYVSAPRVTLRDRVAAIYNKTGAVTNGEKVQVLATDRRFIKVRTPRGEVGWMEQRYLVDQKIFEAFQQLAAENKDDPVQGHGVARVELNIHIAPDRQAERLYQLENGDKVEILKRATAERLSQAQILRQQQQEILVERADAAVKRDLARQQAERERAKKNKIPLLEPPPRTAPPGPPASMLTKTPPAVWDELAGVSPTLQPPPPKVYDDWWLIRNSRGEVGWVLARMIDLDVPLDVAQYAEGQRIMAAFVLNTVNDPEKGPVAQYLMLLNEPKDGLPYDFNQVRVFTWDVRHHRYGTAYRERNIVGYFPASVGQADFGDHGSEPTFTLREQNEDGSITPHHYRMDGNLVRRVLGPGEQPQKTASSAPPKTEREKKRLARKKEMRRKRPPVRRERRR